MKAIKTSAQFAAYVWFTGTHGDSPAACEEAAQFARGHWEEFLPSAHKGLGRLLIRIARGGRRRTADRGGRFAALAGAAG